MKQSRGFFPVGRCWGRQLLERQPAVLPWLHAFTPYKVVGEHEVVGQFCMADELSRRAAGSWGLRFSRRSHRITAAESCYV
jgi:hypothetical protein